MVTRIPPDEIDPHLPVEVFTHLQTILEGTDDRVCGVTLEARISLDRFYVHDRSEATVMFLDRTRLRAAHLVREDAKRSDLVVIAAGPLVLHDPAVHGAEPDTQWVRENPLTPNQVRAVLRCWAIPFYHLGQVYVRPEDEA